MPACPPHGDGRWLSDSGRAGLEVKGDVRAGEVQVGDAAVEVVVEAVRLDAVTQGAWGA